MPSWGNQRGNRMAGPPGRIEHVGFSESQEPNLINIVWPSRQDSYSGPNPESVREIHF